MRRRCRCFSLLCGGRRLPGRRRLGPFDRGCSRGMGESVLLEAHRTVAAGHRKRWKAEDRVAVAHIDHKLAEEGIGLGQAGRIVAAVEGAVDSLEDNLVAAADHKHLAVADIPVEHIGPEVEVGHSPVAEGMESDFEVDIAPGELLGNLAGKSLDCSQHKDSSLKHRVSYKVEEVLRMAGRALAVEDRPFLGFRAYEQLIPMSGLAKGTTM